MYDIALNHSHDLDAFREAARRLIAAGVPPHELVWHDDAEAGLFATPDLPAGEPLMVTARFAQLAEDVICHRAAERLALLYELVWRLTQGEPQLLSVAADPLVHRLARMQKETGRDIHKMHAFVRFRRVETEAGERFAAWFEPQHVILKRAAPFFVDRFAAMRWSILTPVGSAHWDGAQLSFGEAVGREHAPAGDDLDEWWRAYYRATFNPARANPELMRAHMPKHYWRNLPEATLIPELLSEAAARTKAMVEAAPTSPRKRSRPFTPTALPSPHSDFADLAREAAGCERCPLFASATQTVFGAGPQDARMMLVGEQPGDQEDLSGEAFTGPAGQLLDRALAAAGIERSQVYVTNAVKHFKFEPRGKRRLHKTPGGREIQACRWWLERELALVKPELVVALGATAAQSLLGRSVRILSERGSLVEHPGGFTVLITVHPSFLLRLPDADARQREFAAFLRDLRSVGALPTRPCGNESGRNRQAS
jgi:uracil-DNA glycosylase